MSGPRKYDELRTLAMQVRASEEEEGVIEGLAAPFGTPTPVEGAYLETLTRETFYKSVTMGAGAKAPLLLHHKRGESPVGKVLDWEIRDDGLHGRWVMDLKSERGAEAWRMAKDGFLTGLSVGFQPNSDEDRWDMVGDVHTVVRRDAALREVSLVSVAAYEDAEVTLVRTAGINPAAAEEVPKEEEKVVDPKIEEYRRIFGLKSDGTRD